MAMPYFHKMMAFQGGDRINRNVEVAEKPDDRSMQLWYPLVSGVINGMSLNINLPNALEHAIRERAMAAGVDIDTFAATIFSERLQLEEVSPNVSSAKDIRETLDRVIALHPRSRHFVDDSREFIYTDRSE